MGKKYKADKISIGGHTLDESRMVILDNLIEGGLHSEAGYISSFTDTNTHLTDAEIAAMGYIKTYTDTNTNTQLSDAQIAEMGYIKTYTDTNTNTQLTSAQIAAMGYLSTATGLEVFRSEKNIDDQGTYMFAQDDGGWTGGARLAGAHNGYGVISMHLHADDYYGQIHLSAQTGDMGIRFQNASSTWGSIYTVHTSKHFSTADVANGKTAHGWGNHADEGYLTSYTDTDTNTQLTSAEIAAMGYTGDQDLSGYLTLTGKAADSELIDGIDSSRIVYGANAKRSTRADGVGIMSTTQNSGFHYGSSPTDGPTTDWNNWITCAGGAWAGGNNYDFKISHPFHSDKLYVGRMENGVNKGWRQIFTTGMSVDIGNNNFTGAAFYDSNDTNYYLNPAGTSSINGLELNGDVDMKDQVGTWITSDVFNDAIGWNDSYGVYIGSNVGGTHYLRGNGTFTTGGSTYTLYHTGNLPSIPSGNSIIDWTANQGSTNIHSGNYTNTNTQLTPAQVLTSIKAVDGSGSGLDADTVDGSHSNLSYGAGKQYDFTINGDADTFYPVVINGASNARMTRLTIFRGYSETAPSTWNNASHKGGLTLDMDVRFGGWGGYPNMMNVHDFGEIYSRICGGAAWTAHTMKFVVWLRGGGASYHIDSPNINLSIEVNDSTSAENYKTTNTWYSYDHSNVGYDVTVVAKNLTEADTGANALLAYMPIRSNGNQNKVISGVAGLGYISSTGSMRAPYFYDSNDTSYYLDPASSSNLFSVTAQHFYGNITGNASTATLAATATTANLIKVNDYAGTTNMRILGSHQTGGSDNVYSNASMYLNCDTGIINATGFVGNLTGNASSATIAAAYLPLSGGALTGDITVGSGKTSSNIYMADSDGTARRIHTNSNRIGFLTSGNGWGSYCTNNGDWTTDMISYAGASMRAPVFYDSNDTNYYLNPASTSNLNIVQAVQFQGSLAGTASNANTLDGFSSESFLRSDADDAVNAGVTYTWTRTDTAGIVFVNNSYNTQLAIGGWTNTNSDNISRIRTSSGNLHIDSAANGSLYLNWYSGGAVKTNSLLQSDASLRAPIFYDSNNTSYYVDAGSTTQLNHLSVNSTFKSRNFGTAGMGYQLENRDAGGATFRFDGDTFIFYGAGGVGNVFEMNQSGYGQASSSLRAPIFYDSDDTNYYVNPNTTTTALKIKGAIDVTSSHGGGNIALHYNYNNTDTYRGNMVMFMSEPGVTHDGGGIGCNIATNSPYYGRAINHGYGVYLRFDKTSGHFEFWNTQSTAGNSSGRGTRRFHGDASGNTFSSASSRAPIFYDTNNTGYYLNPASTSNLNVLTLAGTATASNFILSSDERKKTKIKDLTRNNINTNWKSFEMKNDEGEYRTGVIAQELEETHPEFVNTDSEGFKSVKYIDLLIAKIAELEARLEKLEK